MAEQKAFKTGHCPNERKPVGGSQRFYPSIAFGFLSKFVLVEENHPYSIFSVLARSLFRPPTSLLHNGKRVTSAEYLQIECNMRLLIRISNVLK
jgi:hypothetical protein